MRHPSHARAPVGRSTMSVRIRISFGLNRLASLPDLPLSLLTLPDDLFVHGRLSLIFPNCRIEILGILLVLSDVIAELLRVVLRGVLAEESRVVYQDAP